jgi:hypothetical protein
MNSNLNLDAYQFDGTEVDPANMTLIPIGSPSTDGNTGMRNYRAYSPKMGVSIRLLQKTKEKELAVGEEVKARVVKIDQLPTPIVECNTIAA